MKHSLKEEIVKYLSITYRWHPKGELTDYMKWTYIEKGIEKTYLSETVGRKLREAESEGRIAVKDDGISVQYKFLPVERRSLYITYSNRIDKNKIFKDY